MAKAIVNIDVSDLPSAVRFCAAAFGLAEGRHFGESAIELTGGGATIILLQADAGTPPFKGATITRDYHRHWTPVHLDFAVRDISAALQRALAAGAKQESEVQNHGFGQLVVLSDPFGHGVCLLQFKEA